MLPVLLLQGEVTIHYNKLQADPKQGMSLDIGKLARAVVPLPANPHPKQKSSSSRPPVWCHWWFSGSGI